MFKEYLMFVAYKISLKIKLKKLSLEDAKEEVIDFEMANRFETKEKQIYTETSRLSSGRLVNKKHIDSIAKMIRNILKRKSGQDYRVDAKAFELTIEDYVDYLLDKYDLLSEKEKIMTFFTKTKSVTKYKKRILLVFLIESKTYFHDFLKDLDTKTKKKKIFEKYYTLYKNNRSRYHLVY